MQEIKAIKIENQNYLTAEALAWVLDRTKISILSHVKKGLKHMKIGGTYLIPVSEIRDYPWPKRGPGDKQLRYPCDLWEQFEKEEK